MRKLKIKTYIYELYNRSPYETLAAEEFILNNIKENEVVLFLYSHPKAVIIGRNQNAWKECRVSELEANGGALARRISGGGAVYHDLGNLNFSFILNRDKYNLFRQQQVLCEAVNSLGLNARISGRNDILAGDRKFSGNAFCFKKNNAFHHGTVLIDTDMSELSKYLNVSLQKMKSKGINSVKSRVVNLSELNPKITPDKAASAIKESFENEYGKASLYIIEEKNKNKVLDIEERNASWEWKYGKSPKFDIVFEEKFDWGLTEIQLSLKDGIISDCIIYSDAIDADLISNSSRILKGEQYNANSITRALNSVSDMNSDSHKIIKDLSRFFAEQNI